MEMSGRAPNAAGAKPRILPPVDGGFLPIRASLVKHSSTACTSNILVFSMCSCGADLSFAAAAGKKCSLSYIGVDAINTITIAGHVTHSYRFQEILNKPDRCIRTTR